MSRTEKYEIYRELEDLALKMNYSVDCVVVEGPHDKKTLELLGYKGLILLFSRFSMLELVDLIAKKFDEIVVLTDFDEAGEKFGKNLIRLLSRKRIKSNVFYRKKFRKLLKKASVSTIEGIYRLKLELFRY